MFNIAGVLLYLFSVQALLAEVPASVALDATACRTAPFFRPADTVRPAGALADYRPVSSFPILLNNVHKPERNGALLHYSLVCDVIYPGKAGTDQYLYLQGIGENFDIYLNGEKVHSDTHVAGNELAVYRYVKFLHVPLPGRLMREGHNTIFFHFAGYAPLTPLSGNFLLGLPFRSGYSLAGEREQSSGSLLLFFLTASYVFFGLYHFFFYLRWREKQYNLHFALFSLAISGYFLAFSQEAFARIQNTRYLIMASYACQMMALAFFLLYVQKFFFEVRRVPVYIRIAVAVDLLLASAVLTGHDTWNQSLLIFWYFTAVPQILIVFWLIGNAVKLKLPEARLLATSIFAALLMIAFDMLDTLVFYSSIRLSPFAYFTVVASLVLLMANRFININLETDRLNRQLSIERNSFSRFVPAQFLENLGKSTALEIKRGDTAQRRMGILFLDIRNFTGIAENLSPSESLVFLNIFMKKMEQCISQNGGFVDKYIGDGLLALFGSSDNSLSEGANRAVLAGRQMLRTLPSFGRYSKKFGKIRIGIGIHCGSLVMGTLGSRRRLDTTVIGDAVNLASRLEMLTTLYGSSLLLSGDVCENLAPELRSDIRQIDTVKVKGRRETVTICEDFHSDSAEIAALKKQGQAKYDQAFRLYENGNFTAAEDEFDAINRDFAFDAAAATLSRRCHKLAKSGAPAGWNGILRLEKK